jgi:hypothetical protein
MQTSPLEMGFPINRQRRYAVCRRTATTYEPQVTIPILCQLTSTPLLLGAVDLMSASSCGFFYNLLTSSFRRSTRLIVYQSLPLNTTLSLLPVITGSLLYLAVLCMHAKLWLTTSPSSRRQSLLTSARIPMRGLAGMTELSYQP